MNYLAIAVLFLGMGSLGYSLIRTPWDGKIAFYPNGERIPATAQRISDLSYLEGQKLKQALSEHVLSSLAILNKEDHLGLQIDHFVIRDDLGKKTLACNVYNNIRLKFQAVDMAISGEPISMIVESPCTASQNLNLISPIWIPVKKILNEKTGDLELSYMEDRPLTIKFINMGSTWPKSWSLIHMEMYSEEKNIRFSKASLSKHLKKPIVLKW